MLRRWGRLLLKVFDRRKTYFTVLHKRIVIALTEKVSAIFMPILRREHEHL